MIARTAPSARSDAGLAPIFLAAFLGMALIFTAGFVHSAVMHDAAHDTRHSVGFPCH